MANRLELENKLDETNRLLGLMVKENLPETTNWADIAEIVKSGEAQEVFSIGDQLTVNWTDTATNTTYQVPMDVVAFRDVTLEDGETVPGMLLQWHYCSPFGVQFSQNQAFYYAESGLSAGTYHFTMGNSWGSNVVSGKSYQFTLTTAVPAKGLLQLGTASSEISGLPDTAPSNWRVRTYASNSATTTLEVVSLTEGSSGTDLGTLSSSTKPTGSGDEINNMQRSAYGYNRWSQSALRQFLNSSADKGSWWTAQNNFDRVPNELASKNGFMSGFEEDFLNVLKKVKVTTFKNTASDDGASEDTYDTFFIPSLQEIYCNPQVSGEGEYYPYWKRKSGRSTPCAQGGTYTQMRTFGVENHNSAQTVRLRSAYRGGANNTWIVNSSGGIYYSLGATGSFRFSPVCVIC